MGNTDTPENDSGLSAQSFDYILDERRIAQEPLIRRDLSRLMVLNRSSGTIGHKRFGDLPRLLRPGDLLVLNDTSVIPAKFFARRASGGRIEGLFLHQEGDADILSACGEGVPPASSPFPAVSSSPQQPQLKQQQQQDAGKMPSTHADKMSSPHTGTWLALLKNAQKCRIGEQLQLEGAPDVRLEMVENLGQGQYRLAVHPPLQAQEVLGQAGVTPLPPYIHRSATTPQGQADRNRYQTVYASVPGAVAAPTAGLHFTPDLLEDLAAQGIATTRLTLHVGMGTFLPVKCDDLKTHKMHSEWYDLSAGAAEAINRARREGRRIVAVGTTSVRVLETVARLQERELQEQELAKRGLRPISSAKSVSVPALPESPPDLVTAGHGWTDIFLYPPCRFLAVDALITNFHLPKSTLLMLVAAFCSPGKTDGVPMILQAYQEAIRQEYRFYSYGDAMLIE
jgi:S-adenosylmethionine:tRNA ribosyltransferase-isomerase